MRAPIVEDRLPLEGVNPEAAQPVDSAELEGIAARLLSLPGSLGSKLEAIERAAIAETMRSCGHNKSEAARVLGMDRKALERRWQRFQSDMSEPSPSPSGTTTTATSAESGADVSGTDVGDDGA